MPGLYGIYDRRAAIERREPEKIFASMGERLIHRRDYVAATMTEDRCSIGKIGFRGAPEPRGPVWNDDRSLVSFLDGAIFSYHGRNGIMCEVYDQGQILNRVMAEYKRDGIIDTSALNAEYNLVMYSIFDQQLHIANDRWGFRELFYFTDDHLFLFALEIKALLRYADLRLKLSEHSLSDFLNYGYILGDRTFIEGVSLLPPGSILSVDTSQVRLKSRDFSYQVTWTSHDADEYVDTVYRLLERAVQRRLPCIAESITTS
jgi:asparagine synthetase B (glutamine-hydrolysing)